MNKVRWNPIKEPIQSHEFLSRYFDCDVNILEQNIGFTNKELKEMKGVLFIDKESALEIKNSSPGILKETFYEAEDKDGRKYVMKIQIANYMGAKYYIRERH